MSDYPAEHIARNWTEIYAQLSPIERAVFPYLARLWLRPDQWIELTKGLRVQGFIAGRAWGKTYTCAAFLNRLVALGYGRTGNGFGLCGPSEKVVHEVQVTALIETAVPWDVPVATKSRLVWPSGAQAMIYSAEAPEAMRGANLEVTWCTELVAWPRSSARRTWENLSLATRITLELMLYDTTSQGRKPVILDRKQENRERPDKYRLTTGTSFDNPCLGPGFFEAIDVQYPNKKARAYQEEILGMVFEEAGGALWKDEWIEAGRREIAPPLEQVIVALDPARSEEETADEFGLVVAGRAFDGEIYVLEDHSGHFTMRHAAEIIVSRCQRDAAGVVWEANNTGQSVIELVQMVAEQRGLVLHPIPDGKPFPKRMPGRIYTRKIVTFRSKEARADAPAELYAAGRVHHVGNLSRLEEELTTWEPGDDKTPRTASPNRLDALVYAVSELADVGIYRKTAPAADAKAAALASATMRQAFERAAAQKRIGL